jgi:hypothetical protein
VKLRVVGYRREGDPLTPRLTKNRCHPKEKNGDFDIALVSSRRLWLQATDQEIRFILLL